MGKITGSITCGLGGTPLMRLSERDAAALVRAAYDGGIRLFHAPTVPSARRIAAGLKGCAGCEIAVSVRSAEELEEYFAALDAEKIDIALVDAEAGCEPEKIERLAALGRVGAVGIETRRLATLRRAAESGRYAVAAAPFNCLASDEELTAASECAESGMRLLALEPLAGGLWQDVEGAVAFIADAGGEPLFGAQYMWQLEQLLPVIKNPPALDMELWNRIHTQRAQLAESYCRGCGECLPCPVGIDIPLAARMGQFIACMDVEPLLSAETERQMRLVRRCVGCGRCSERCRHRLPVRALMRMSADLYRDFLREHGGME